jgi:hypothetical protein
MLLRIATLLLSALGVAFAAGAGGMDQDPEARALRQRFETLSVAGATLKDNFDGQTERRVTGPVTMGPGVRSAGNPADRAASFPEDRSDALYVYYGPVLPRRARLSVDFRVDKLPRDHGFMTLCSAGTAGNTKFYVRLGLDRRVTVCVLTRRENITLIGDPVELSRWHQLQWWYAPEGSLLTLDGVVQDYSTDYCVPYAVEAGEAFYLGDQPWWDAGSRQGIFYPLDSFVGLLDNLELVSLK